MKTQNFLLRSKSHATTSWDKRKNLGFIVVKSYKNENDERKVILKSPASDWNKRRLDLLPQKLSRLTEVIFRTIVRS